MADSIIETVNSNVAILVCTYKRPELLDRCLRSVMNDGSNANFRCIVVDNDPAGSAKEVCARYTSVDYKLEPRPGIAHARNAGIESALNSDVIIFVDDDEVVCPSWIDLMVSTAARSGADMVAGPVLSNLPTDCPPWIRKSGLFDRPRHGTGEERQEAASGNLLMRTQIFKDRVVDDWFDLEFGLSGGSDAELTRRLVRDGHRIVWCDEAWAVEDVPSSRATLRWLIRRQMRLAGVDFRLRSVNLLTRGFFLASGAARIVIGSCGMLFGMVTERRIDARWFRMTFRGVGFVRAVFELTVVEYGR